MSITELKNKLLATDKGFAKEYEKIDLAFEVSEMVFEARINAGLSQSALAKKIGTKQSSIARVESGESLPSLSFLQKIAKALKTELVPPQFKNVTRKVESDTPVRTIETHIPSPFLTTEGVKNVKVDYTSRSTDNSKQFNSN